MPEFSLCLPPVPLPPRFVSTQRKPEEDTTVHDSDAKQAKPEQNTVNGSSDSSANSGNGVQEGKSQQEASDGHVPFLYRRRGGDGACSSGSSGSFGVSGFSVQRLHFGFLFCSCFSLQL